LASRYFLITQTFGSLAIYLDKADIAWIQCKAGCFCIGKMTAEDAIAAASRRSAGRQQREVWRASQRA